MPPPDINSKSDTLFLGHRIRNRNSLYRFTIFLFIFSVTLACDITERQARRGVSAALAKSRVLGVKLNICIVGADANLKYFVRMDDTAIGKAKYAIEIFLLTFG